MKKSKRTIKIRVDLRVWPNKVSRPLGRKVTSRAAKLPNVYVGHRRTNEQKYTLVRVCDTNNVSDGRSLTIASPGTKKIYFAKNDKVTKTIKTNIVCCGDGPKGSGDGGTPPYTIIKRWGRK